MSAMMMNTQTASRHCQSLAPSGSHGIVSIKMQIWMRVVFQCFRSLVYVYSTDALDTRGQLFKRLRFELLLTLSLLLFQSLFLGCRLLFLVLIRLLS